eukprot:symbB.v1.2.021896.t1/scaffold1900.1/size96683/4
MYCSCLRYGVRSTVAHALRQRTATLRRLQALALGTGVLCAGPIKDSTFHCDSGSEGHSSPTPAPLRNVTPRRPVHWRLWHWFRVWVRCLELALRAMPVLTFAPLCWMCWEHGGERWMWRLILAALQAEGPIAIKFAQWASTRPDILPRSVCDHLSPLQASVRPHSFRQTKRILTETFGPTWENSLQLEAEPLGSGCMAQVHRGCLRGPLQGQLPTKQDVATEPRHVAVKVLHPGAQDRVDLDLEALQLGLPSR